MEETKANFIKMKSQFEDVSKLALEFKKLEDKLDNEIHKAEETLVSIDQTRD